MTTRDLTHYLENLHATGALDVSQRPEYRDALRAYKSHALANYDRKPTRYLSAPSDNAKLRKGNGRPIFGLALAPADRSGAWNVCRWSTAGCRASCLGHSAGKYGINTPKSPRVATEARTTFLGANPSAALALITGEIDRAVAKYGEIAVRLNVLSDLRWESFAPDMFTRYGDAVQFYDYTKAPARNRGNLGNYALTGSITERDSASDVIAKLDDYGSAAVVFDTKRGRDLPAVFLGFPVLDGDANDRRYSDAGIIGLRAKGAAIRDRTGFVRSGITERELAAVIASH